MSSFNTLNAAIQCSSSKSNYVGNIQFKFGNTWQLKYSIGQIVKWGGNDIGESNLAEVKVYGILELDECSICGGINTNNEFDIFIEKDFIKELKPMSTPIDYFIKDSQYKVIKRQITARACFPA